MDTKEKILAAAETILRQGEELHVRPLARRSGVSVGTVYNAYSTIDELVLELAARFWDGIADIIRDSCNRAVSISVVQSAAREWISVVENRRFLFALNRHPALCRILPADSIPAIALKNVQKSIILCLHEHHPQLDDATIYRMAVSYTLLFRFLQSGLCEQMPLTKSGEDKYEFMLDAMDDLVTYVNKGIKAENGL